MVSQSPNYDKHPKMTLNVRGFQGQSDELESAIQVSVIDLFLLETNNINYSPKAS